MKLSIPTTAPTQIVGSFETTGWTWHYYDAPDYVAVRLIQDTPIKFEKFEEPSEFYDHLEGWEAAEARILGLSDDLNDDSEPEFVYTDTENF